MDAIEIKGGNRLRGEVEISGAKNSALPIIAATILLDSPVLLKNVPVVQDIKTMIKVIEYLGGKCEFNEHTHTLYVDATQLDKFDAPYELVKKMRASVFVMGPLLSKYKHANVSLPGGCAIGVRPIDQHIKAFEELGAKIHLDGGYVGVRAKKLKGATIYFDVKTVGGTENAIMAAVMAVGITIIENAAKEPEIVDLANFLNLAGAKIDGAGTEKITIEGVSSLKITEYSIIPDRIEAGTYLSAAAITHGDVIVRKVNPEHLDNFLVKFKEIGCSLEIGQDFVHLKAPARLRATNIITAPYPGFPTDMQAQFMAIMCVAKGTSTITETIFENRFMHVAELRRLGADIKVVENTAVVNGVKSLIGAPVMATDLRASAALVLAGLVAKGKTTINRVYHLDRGYEFLEKKLESIGANIKRVKGGLL